MQSLDCFVGIVADLSVYKLSHRITNGNHTFDTVFSRYRGFDGLHNGILTVINLTVHKRKGIVFNRWICGYKIVLLPRKLLTLYLLHFCVEICHRIGKQSRKLSPLKRSASGFYTKLTASRSHFSQYHIGVINEILIHFNTVLVLAEIYPIGIGFYNAVTLLQKDNVRHGFRAGIIPKSALG